MGSPKGSIAGGELYVFRQNKRSKLKIRYIRQKMRLFKSKKKQTPENTLLSDEERKKIEEEENLRARLKEKEEKKKQSKKAIGCLTVIIIVVVFFIIIFSGGGGGTPTTQQGTSDSMAYIQSQAYVKTALKSPASAKFPFADYEYKKYEDDSYLITSYVDAQNNFGAMIRNNYTAVLKYLGGEDADPNNWELKELIIDGKQIYPSQ